ncbi:condensation domain-containing protein [Streptomyces megasporus]|uniref:condensation domain-containing protein n=1 Tax=Streptomyces megasporus TaxID=44060 RepID=UPI0004E1A7FA|nr:condensation domain-containing protein [Streptomyces megasporus]
MSSSVVADHPLTSPQQGMWFLERMSGTSVYVDPMTFRLTGALDVPALRRSIEELRRRHEALRSVFPVVDGRPVQRVTDESAVDVPVVDLSPLPAREREAELTRLLEEDARRRFDLARGPVMRAMLLRLGPEEHVLRMTVHHIVSDAWSWWNVLLRELETLYTAELEGGGNPLGPPPAQFSDFVRWQHRWCEGPGYRRQLAYWKERLAGLRPLPELDLAGTAEPAVGGSTTTQWATVPRPVYTALRELAGRERATLFMVLLAAFKAVLHRHSGTADIAVGTRTAVRSRPEYHDAVGFFVNLLVIRTDLAGVETFRDLVRAVRGSALGAYAHREIPFEKLVEELRPPRRGGFHTLVNVLFSFQSTPEVPPGLPGLEARIVNHDPQTLYDLDLVFYEEDGDLRALLSHGRARFGEQALAGLLAELGEVLATVADDPGTPLSTLLTTTGATHHAG